MKAIRKIAYKFVDGIISLTKEDEEKYLKVNSKTYVIPNPIPFEPIQYFNRKNTVITIGSLNKRKAIDRLLNIWSVIEKRNKNYELKIYGEGPEKENLIKQSVKLGLNMLLLWDKQMIFKMYFQYRKY